MLILLIIIIINNLRISIEDAKFVFAYENEEAVTTFFRLLTWTSKIIRCFFHAVFILARIKVSAERVDQEDAYELN